MRIDPRSRLTSLTVGALVLVLGSAGLLTFHGRTARAAAPTSSPARGGVASAHASRAPMAASKDDRLEHAVALHAQAESLQAAGQAREAAALHRASAALRSTDDPMATNCLEAAGILLGDVGNFREARVVMRDGAAHAMARGDVARAADLTLLAGFVAREQGDTAGVVAQAREARWLANAPSLTPGQRSAILTRIGYTGTTR